MNNRRELIDYLEAMKQEMEDVYVPLLADDPWQDDLASQCLDVKQDILRIVDRKIKELRRLDAEENSRG